MRVLKPQSHWWAIAFGVLTTGLVIACSSPAAASIPPTGLPTPVPPAALSTLPPPKPPAAAPTGGPAVGIENFNYVPAELSVPTGTTVTWTNHDDVQHTITASDNSFSSQAIDTDGTFSHTFSTPGTYSYFCAIHPFMTAKVTVQ